jgi:hypothetical protein
MAKKQRSALAWGIILIVIGLVFILENLGVDAWANLFRLWPLILIAWGAWKLYFGIKERNQETPLPKPGQE